jgi:predicted MPP superfamily phosphohydrolase
VEGAARRRRIKPTAPDSTPLRIVFRISPAHGIIVASMHNPTTAVLEEQATEKRAGRKRVARRGAMALGLVAAVAAADAFFIEPNWIVVTHEHIAAPLAAPLKIALLADLHTSGLDWRERRLLQLLDAEKPDLIAIAGDTVTPAGKYKKCRELLARLHAPLGVWLVRGNWEIWLPLQNEHEFYSSAGVHFLLNEAQPVREGVWLVGLDDASAGSPNLKRALKDVPPGAYLIALFHSPAYFDRIAGRCSLVLAAHTHGGQVRLPFLRPFWLPKGSGRFLEGAYEESGTVMYVSRGIGMSILPVRFLCRPELAILTIGR